MALFFATLASGSKGNAALVRLNQKTLLIDAGIPARTLKSRLGQLGLALSDITECILTHTHSDHANGTAMQALANQGVLFRCHPSHEEALSAREGFLSLKEAGLVMHYGPRPFFTATGLEVAPIELRHGAGMTFGFRINHHQPHADLTASVAYFADLGCWNDRISSHFSDCNLLAMEFNHDVAMTHASGRHPMIIARNLSDDGHLSNAQAAALLRQLLARSGVMPGHVVLLHISHECNTRELAVTSAESAIRVCHDDYIPVVSALQDESVGWIPVSYRKISKELAANSKPDSDLMNPLNSHKPEEAGPVGQSHSARGRSRRRVSPNQLELAFPA